MIARFFGWLRQRLGIASLLTEIAGLRAELAAGGHVRATVQASETRKPRKFTHEARQ